ncbi:RagB/SusD family nutrient uptake outer membrane protein [Albibacterium profundi]|uniref:RagB/SusD family nutrient uptake outer membrane protein n=1 Tax=Albibacterium profundi TaxID=3134906 RepID=A0ABV5CFW3_9SPHI
MKNKYKILVVFCFTGLTLVFSSCKDFLNVTPVDNLSGNNYWKTVEDVEAYTAGIYSRFRDATMTNMFFPATGDMRGAPVKPNVNGREYITELRQNNLKAYLARDGSFFGFQRPTQWDDFYNMVQSANILYEQMDRLEPGVLSETDRVKYRAEAVFLRNLAYFFMVRLYGDVPYYTDAYNSEPLPRMNQIEVLDNCIADLMAVKNDLPWTFDDPSIVAVRAMRGSAIALLMHMNMWNAGFAEEKTPYYEATAKLGDEILNNPGAYELLPLEETKEIFKGRTKEGLFEILQSLNYGERFSIVAQFSDYVLHYPNKITTKSYVSYDPKFMDEIYPLTAIDRRKEIWFDEDMYNTDGSMQLLKFVNIFAEEGEDQNPDDNQVVFRYADVILLHAEALAELGRDEEARTSVNMIRERAGATAFTSSGQQLKDNIYWERCRELMGEGHYFYDLVRTKKAVDSDYSFAPIGVDAFNRGAWTWPIDESAMDNNPYMVLNNYWR